jgi:cell division protein FtsQ
LARTRAPSRKTKPSGDEAGLWDSPRALTMIADCILLIAAAALGYALVITFTRMPVMPLNTVLIKSAPTNVTTAQIEDAARRSITGNFLTTDVEHARAVFGKLPWVRSASVRRAWPGSIEIELEEHEAVARWWVPESTQARMMNTHGELFVAEHDSSLPLFIGPDEHAAHMLQRYAEWSGALSPLTLRIKKIALTRREAWQLFLDDSSRIELGREDDKNPISARLARYVTTQPGVQRDAMQKIIYADLRYNNGYAIRMTGTDLQDRP